ncbi:MAG: hypothetical protein KGL35_21055 [Bradyrhizobium sp.]|nr:hypothetical protein [Bradyrhizobium sp.]
MRIPDIVTPPIALDPRSKLGERFGFTKIGLEPLNRYHHGWIYGAEYSSHRFNYMPVEILAGPIEGVAPGLPCTTISSASPDMSWSDPQPRWA